MFPVPILVCQFLLCKPGSFGVNFKSVPVEITNGASPAHGDALRPDYHEFSPGPALQGFVECFWTSRVREARRTPAFHRVLPDGCMDVLFDFVGSGSERALVIGTMTRPLSVCRTGPIDFLGARFRPGGLRAILALDAAEMTDAQADLRNFWPQRDDDTWHRLGEATPADRPELLREMLAARLKSVNQIDPFIRHSVARIEAARGELRIGELQKSTGLSSRQLERKFASHVGISPKMFARVARFKAAAAAATKSKRMDWATLACDFGFADQPHLAREFKALSGLTPWEYLEESPFRRNVGNLQDPIATSG